MTPNTSEPTQSRAARMMTTRRYQCLRWLLILTAICVAGCKRVEQREHISRSEATNLVLFPLVNSATNIYFYAAVGGLQSLDCFIRIQVAKADVTNQLNMMIAENNRHFSRVLPYTETNIRPSEVIMPQGVKLTWWSPNKITNGFYRGEVASYAFQIWVNESDGTIFVHQND